MKFTFGLAVILLGVLGLAEVGRADGGVVIEGAGAHIRTIGGGDGKAWNLWSNGSWGDYVNFGRAGACRVRVRCYGSVCGGVWPEMGFCVDGAIQKTVAVDTSQPREFTFEFAAQARPYRIEVSFLNDAKNETEDRNLYVISMSIEAPDSAPALSNDAAWRPQWTRRQIESEEQTLAAARDAIEKNRKSDAIVEVVDEGGHPAAGANVEVELINHEFLFGANIFNFDKLGTARENEAYKDRFRELFNFATTGFYWHWYEAQRGKPDYAYTDKVVAWCAANHIRVKGHPLLWACEAGTPTWSKGPPSMALSEARVREIVSRYAGKIDFWEVVNEPAHLPGITIDDPYRWARAADPKARLIVNEYSVLSNGCPEFFSLLQDAIRKGTPFDGVGMQAHEPIAMRFPMQQVSKYLDQYGALGKAIYITEFEPTSGGQPITGSYMQGKWDETAQADYAVKFYTVCFACPAVKGITWWDVCDKGSWQAGGGLLRVDLSPKPVYAALKKLIHEQWTTRIGGITDKDGRFAFRGFRGQYIARITRNGKTDEVPFSISAGEAGAGIQPIRLVVKG